MAWWASPRVASERPVITKNTLTMSSPELYTTFAKCHVLLNARGFRFTRVTDFDKEYSVFRLYQDAEPEPKLVGLPVRIADRGLGVVIVPGEPHVAYIFLYNSPDRYAGKPPRPTSECYEVALSGGHVKWTNALMKELQFFDFVEFQSGLAPFDPKAVPEAVYTAVK